MVKTIGNPGSWFGQVIGRGARHLMASTEELGGTSHQPIALRPITVNDIGRSLRRGWEDFIALRSDAAFIVLIYPVIGIALAFMAFHRELLPLLVPLIGGFALLGPAAATGLYELSRRREAGEDVTWVDAFGVLRSPALLAVLVMSFYLLAIFLVWLMSAWAIYAATLGPEPPVTAAGFVRDVFTTGAGWLMAVAGLVVGAGFAALVLMLTIISFPLVIDRHVGILTAVRTSFELSRRNPATVAMWGGVIVIGLGLGFATALVGLIVVLPVLGHATWHLYRAAVPRQLPRPDAGQAR